MSTVVTLTPADTSPWPVPAGVSSVQAEIWANGGNGSAAISGSRTGASGGGGEYAAQTVAVTPGGTAAFTCRSGGSASTSTFVGNDATVTAHPGGNASTSTAGTAGSGSANGTHFNGGAGRAASVNSSIAGPGGGSSAGTGSAGNQGAAGSGGTGGAGGTAPAGGFAGGPGGTGTAFLAHPDTGGGGGGGGNRFSASQAGDTGGDAMIVLTFTAAAPIAQVPRSPVAMFRASYY